ncbi:MAG: hypothetical protein LBK69_03325 [Syntrophomonadaceae bacterium]|nr:hypothetical protein [Syntrophomonadaceae bacterium]
MKLTIKIGLLCVVAMNLINQFADIPFLSGLLAGIGICFLIMGLLPRKMVDALKSWKRTVFRQA